MDHLTAAVRQALAQSNWHAALALALTLPDVCASLQGRPEGWQRYVAWCDEYLARDSQTTQDSGEGHWSDFCGGDVYALRCAVLHAGGDTVEGRTKRRTALESFSILEPGQVNQGIALVYGYIPVSRQIQVRVDWLCEWICVGVDRWLGAVLGTDRAVEDRIGGLMRVREQVWEIHSGGHMVMEATAEWHAAEESQAPGANDLT